MHSFVAKTSMSSPAGVLSLVFFAEAFCVTSCAGLRLHGLWQGFYNGFFPGDKFCELFRRASSACTFAGISSGLSLGDILRELFRMDIFHGFFCQDFSVAILYSGYLRALFRGLVPCLFFAVASSVHFFAGKFPWDLSL